MIYHHPVYCMCWIYCTASRGYNLVISIIYVISLSSSSHQLYLTIPATMIVNLWFVPLKFSSFLLPPITDQITLSFLLAIVQANLGSDSFVSFTNTWLYHHCVGIIQFKHSVIYCTVLYLTKLISHWDYAKRYCMGISIGSAQSTSMEQEMVDPFMTLR